MSGSFQSSPSFRFSHLNAVCICFLPHTCHMSRPIQINMSAAGSTWPMDVLPLGHPTGKKTRVTLHLHYILLYNNELSTKLNLIFYSICLRSFQSRPYHGLGIHWWILIAKAAFSPMAVYVRFIGQMTANKGAPEYEMSRRKGLTIFTLHIILYKRKLPVAPNTRGIASNYIIMATNSLQEIWKKDGIAWLKVLFQR